jgi:hypothetical protein
VREGGGKEEGTSKDTICLSNKEMQSVFSYSLAQSKAVLLACGERESQRGRESEVTSSLRSRAAPLSRRRETVVGSPLAQAPMRGVNPAYTRDERERRESEVTLFWISIEAPLSRRRAAALE